MKPVAAKPAVVKPVPQPEVHVQETAEVAEVLTTAMEGLTEVAEELATVAEELADMVEVTEEKPEGEKRGGRRRRRRRRKPREAGTEPSQVSADESEITDVREELVGDVLDTLNTEPATTATPEETTSTEKRPKRRRRRGRSRDKGAAKPPTDTVASDKPKARLPESDEPDAHDDLDDMVSDEDGDVGDGDEKSARVGLRNIPTWDETVGVVIAANMESRAKHPGNDRSPGGSRGRGGHRNSRRRPPSKG